MIADDQHNTAVGYVELESESTAYHSARPFYPPLGVIVLLFGSDEDVNRELWSSILHIIS